MDAAVPYSVGSVNYIHRRQKSYLKRSLGVQSLLVFDLKVVHYLALSPLFLTHNCLGIIVNFLILTGQSIDGEKCSFVPRILKI